MRRPLFASVLALLVSGAAPAAAFDVTACYQTVPGRETGVLQTDLVCDGTGGPNVSLLRHARLDLNGHTISGGYIGVSTDPGRIGKNEIVGPGEIFGVVNGDGGFGAGIAASGKVVVRDVHLHDNVRGIVSVYDFAMKLEGVTITNNSAEGIASYFGNLADRIGPGKGQIKARDCVVSGNGDDGIEAWGRLDLRDATVSGNGGTGIVSRGNVFSLRDVTITDNARQREERHAHRQRSGRRRRGIGRAEARGIDLRAQRRYRRRHARHLHGRLIRARAWSSCRRRGRPKGERSPFCINAPR